MDVRRWGILRREEEDCRCVCMRRRAMRKLEDAGGSRSMGGKKRKVGMMPVMSRRVPDRVTFAHIERNILCNALSPTRSEWDNCVEHYFCTIAASNFPRACWRNSSSLCEPISRLVMVRVFSRDFRPRMTSTLDLGTWKTCYVSIGQISE